VQAYKDAIAYYAKAAGARPTDLPCTLAATAVPPIPASWSVKDRRAALDGLTPHTVKPDWDNLGKVVSDALNGIAWKDDAQVCWANVKKVYGEQPLLQVTIAYP
jgi:Holliday junction resolvase RusA-like endonuclease